MIIKDLPLAHISLIKDVPNILFIDEDFAIFDNMRNISKIDHPMRIGAAVFGLCTKGVIRIGLNMEEFVVRERQLMLSLPEQIIQYIEGSDDVEGYFLVISKEFMDSIISHIQNTLPAFFYIKEHPVTELNNEEIHLIEEYYATLRKKTQAVDHPYRREIIQSMSLAIFYEIYGMLKNHAPIEVKKSRKEVLFSQFIRLLVMHHRHERSVGFYADKLCITAKYLSLLVKEVSNQTAGEWIDKYVILEAKTLLSSTTISIQEIADQLNFANQSFFGKYFKQHVGMSPRQYRKNW